MAYTLGGVQSRNSKDLINENTKLCMLVYAPPKVGKTVFAATLNKLTLKHHGKPTACIGVEDAEGGGFMSARDAGVEIFEPKNFNQLLSMIAALQTDTNFAGVVLDNLSDMIHKFVKPHVLAMPYEKASKSSGPPLSRAEGVFAEGDYQVAGENLRQRLQALIAVTKHPDLKIRKHLITTAKEQDKFDRKTGELIMRQPELAGKMAETATSMFQVVGRIVIKPPTVEAVDPADPKKGTRRVTRRWFTTQGDGVTVIGDRTQCLPLEGCAPDLCEMWEKYYLPIIEANKQAAA